MGRPALRALADRLGVLPSYQPADGGAQRHTSDATREALCAAMGHDASSEAAAREALATILANEAGRPIEPVAVVERGPGARASARGRRAPAIPTETSSSTSRT